MQTICPKCGCPTYTTIKHKLKDKFIAQHVMCRKKSCGKDRVIKLYLIGDPVDKYYYITVSGRNIQMHRWVWEQYNNRELEPFEVVHHLNGLKGDNRPENLFVMTSYDHKATEHPSHSTYKINKLKQRIRNLEKQIAENNKDLQTV